MPNAIWEQIVQIHNEAKTLFILAEEMEHARFQSFLPPILEQRHALEHIIRAKADECGSEPNQEYQRENLKKALGHEYRSYFDCADWLAVILRDDILTTLRPYDSEHIQDAIPEYYSDLRPQLERIAHKVAQIRAAKDVAGNSIIEGVEQYKEVIRALSPIHDRVMAALPGLIELRQKATCKQRETRTWQIISGVLLAAILGLGTLWWQQVTRDASSSDEPPTKAERPMP